MNRRDAIKGILATGLERRPSEPAQTSFIPSQVANYQTVDIEKISIQGY